MLTQLLTIIVPVFFGVSIGFIWSRLGKPFDTNSVTSIVFNIGTPFLIFSTLTRLDIDTETFADLALVIVVALFMFFLISLLLLYILRLDVRTYLATIMIPNTGNVGIPLCFLAFGELGLAYAIIVYTIVSLTQFTLGVAIAAGSFSLLELAKNSLIYAVLAALLVMLTNFQLPFWFSNTIYIFSQFAIPLMLISLGVSLEKIKVTSLPRNIVLSCLRLIIGLGVGLLVSHIFGLEGIARGVIVLQCSMPAAVFNYLLAMRYENNPEEVAGLVITSTVIFFAILPLLLAFILNL